MFGSLLRALRPGAGPDAELARALEAARAGRATEAVRIWTGLAEMGVMRAMTNLGACFANGTGVAADPQAARLWLERGAEAGDALGQRNLATLLLRPNPAGAARWYGLAAEQGDAVSQNELSRMLFEGDGVSVDLAGARTWAERAAAQGIAAAASRLGMMFHEAKGAPRDPAQAASWWHQAAKAGDGDAAAMLGAAYHMGQGVAPDPVEAFAWLLLGSSRGSALVRPFMEPVDTGLVPERRREAEALAASRGWPGR